MEAFRKRFRHFINPALLGIAAITLATGLCRAAHSSFAVTSFVFLIAVLIQSLAGDFLACILASLEAVTSLDYFFVDPRYSFAIARGEDGMALLAFLTASLVVTRLVSRVKAEAQSAQVQKQRIARLYRLAQQLLAIEPKTEIDARLLERFRSVFRMSAVCLFDADTAGIHVTGESRHKLVEKTRSAYLTGIDITDPNEGIWVRRLQVAGRTTGCIGFEGLPDADAIADPLAALAATLLDRTRALRDASQSAAAAQSEVYRSAILDALAHEFKTPLAIILAAAGGVREAGPLDPAQVEMMETVESEAERLGTLTSRLLRMARVGRDEVRPRMETVDLVSLLGKLGAQYASRSPDRRFLFTAPEAVNVQADPELLRLALSQLLENACKYSLPGSTVSLAVQNRNGFTEIRVSNEGSSVPLREQHRIFERFYRGSATMDTPGSGLGLYVARKIALAHGGSLDFASEPAAESEVSFRLTLPGLQHEVDHAVTAS